MTEPTEIRPATTGYTIMVTHDSMGQPYGEDVALAEADTREQAARVAVWRASKRGGYVVGADGRRYVARVEGVRYWLALAREGCR